MFVTCKYCGGLGNQLYQIATTISTAIDQKKEYKFVYMKFTKIGINRST